MNDTPKKNTRKSTTKKAPPNNVTGPSRRLLRSQDDRMLAGVAGGLAQHLSIDSTLVRIGLVIAALFGGVGVLAYLVLAVALPQDDGTGKPVDEPWGARLGRVLLITVLVAAGFVAAAALFAVSAWSTATGHGVIIAAVVIALGALIAGVAFMDDLRRKVAPWLIGVALVLAVPAGAVAAADIDIDESIGERNYKPAAVADLPDDGYELGTGQLVVDLRELPWRAGETIPVEAQLGIGQMIVSVPPEVCVDANAEAKAGELLIAGDQSDGWHADVDQGTPTTNAPRLELDAELQFGQMIVTDEDPDEVDGRSGPGPGHNREYEQNEEMEDAQERICGR
jgi:phage shock protein PspC (stress-responsive transcriptional regulator)